MVLETRNITASDLEVLLEKSEGHFFDAKSKRIAPAKLSRTFSAFANADGGEILIGLEDHTVAGNRWVGFANEEEANSLIDVLQKHYPEGDVFTYQFLFCQDQQGLILACDIQKNQSIWRDTQDNLYLRRGAQSIKQTLYEEEERLRLNKGLVSFEDTKTNLDADELIQSKHFSDFCKTIVPASDPESWLKKQKVVNDGFATVAGVVLFEEEPQATLPKAAIKISRYRTSEEPTRATLEGQPDTIEGPATSLIKSAVDHIISIVEQIPVMKDTGFKSILYPRDAIHEIVTNAVIHRDYSINDDVHVKIFDNRIEISSPGILPAHITVDNILHERFARNQKIVRLANKFPDAPNKDVGEGLNTAFEAMRELKLKDPTVQQIGSSVLVTLRHEKLAEPEQAITNYLRENNEINNKKARSITFIGSENKIKNIFRKMMAAGVIERIPDRSQVKTGYRKGPNFPE